MQIFFFCILFFFFVCLVHRLRSHCLIQWGFISITIHLTIARVQEKKGYRKEGTTNTNICSLMFVGTTGFACYSKLLYPMLLSFLSEACLQLLHEYQCVLCCGEKSLFCIWIFVKPSHKLYHSEVLCSVFLSKISLCFIITAEMFVSLLCCFGFVFCWSGNAC